MCVMISHINIKCTDIICLFTNIHISIIGTIVIIMYSVLLILLLHLHIIVIRIVIIISVM